MPDDPDDLDLRPSPSEPESPEWPAVEAPSPSALPTPRFLWMAGIAGFLLLVGAGAVFRFWPRPATSAGPRPVAAGSVSPPPSTPTPFPLPPLEESDTVVRDLARGLSSHPLLVSWLAQSELVRTLAAVVLNVAEGESPRPHLPFLAPRSAFTVIERRSGRLTLDPASYARYDLVGDAAASLDAGECARVYRLLEPLFESAYRELGHPEGGFSKKLGTAFDRLLEVPLLEGEVPLVEVEKAVIAYAFADEKLEALSIPQKHLIRMGPRNVRRVQEKIRAIAGALGLPVAGVAGRPGGPP